MKFLFGLILVFGPLYASYSQGHDEFKKELGRMMGRKDVSAYTARYFADYAKYQFKQKVALDGDTESQYKKMLAESNPRLNSFVSDFTSIVATNQKNADRDKLVFKGVELLGRVIESPVDAIPVAGPIYKEINNQIFDAAEKELTRNYQLKLANSLAELQKLNQTKYDQILRSGDYNEVKATLEGVHYFSSVSFDGVSEEFEKVIKKSQEMVLQDAVKGSLERVINDLQGQHYQIQDVEEKIANLSQFTFKFAKESNARFNELSEAQRELSSRFTSFYTKYKGQETAVNYMQEFLFSKMSAAEKIEALDGGMLNDRSPEERQNIRDRLQLQKQKEQVINSARRYLNSATIALKVLDDIGLGKSELANSISSAVNIGQAATSAVESFMSGNFLEGISSLTGLFGKEDVASQRHNQIMQRFDKIDASLDEIKGQMKELLRQQQEMLRLQGKTLNTLIALSDQIAAQHNESMTQLKTIEQALYINREINMQEWEGSCQACLEVIRRLQVDVDGELIPSFGTVEKEYVNIQQRYLGRCQDYLATVVIALDKPTLAPQFILASNAFKEEDRITFDRLQKINDLSFRVLSSTKDLVGNLKPGKSLLYSLMSPSRSIEQLENKIHATEIVLNADYYPTDFAIYQRIIKPEVAIRHGFVLRNLDFIVGLTDNQMNLIKWDDYVKSRPPAHANLKDEIVNAIRLNNIAIAQQTILAGDILLPIIFNEIMKYLSTSTKTDLYKLCEELLAENEVLARNFTNYYVDAFIRNSKRDEKTARNEIQYAYAFILKDSLMMTKVISSPFPISYKKVDGSMIRDEKDQGWYMSFTDNRFYKLPFPEDIGSKPLVVTEYLNNMVLHAKEQTNSRNSSLNNSLLANRQRLLQHMLSYGIYDNEEEMISNINYLIIKNE
jgi:hypothetical protein